MIKPIEKNDLILRHIKTARSKKAINSAVAKGYWPLIKALKPSQNIQSKFQIVQNTDTGEIVVNGDYRSCPPNSNWNVVVDWTFYYPHSWPSPFAAYLIPPDLKEGEWVILDDLIEDVIGSSWNQGDTYRLESCRAQWIKGNFILDYDPKRSKTAIFG